MYKTFILDFLFQAEEESELTSEERDSAILFSENGKSLKKDVARRGKDIAKIHYITQTLVWIYSTSPASRCGDEDVGRDFISIPKNKEVFAKLLQA